MTDVLRDGRYRVEELLGSGAMGIVVLAHDTVLDRPVAVKLLADHLAADGAFRARFLREARLAARLCHPNVVQVYDADDDPRPFLVMEYVDGNTVAERLARGERCSAEELQALGTDLSAALAHAHAMGIVHRDLKPHNVLISRTGVAKLADFGIARALEDRGLTEIGTVLGTAPFMAPEQAAGGPVGPGADVFALGAVLRHAAGGALPNGLDSLIQAALAPDPDARPTAGEFYARLSAVKLPAVLAPTAPGPPADTALAEDAPTEVAVPTAVAAPTEVAGAPWPLSNLLEWTLPAGRRTTAAVAVATVLAVIALFVAGLTGHDGGRRGVTDSGAGTVTPVPTAPDPAQAARNLAVWLRDQAQK